MTLAIILGCLLGGAAFRLRGSALIGDLAPALMPGRLLWASAMTALPLAALPLDPWLLLLWPAFFLGSILGWWQTLDLGRDDDRAWWPEATIMAVRGVLWTLLAGAVLWWVDLGWWYGLAGIVCPLCYELAWRIPSRLRGLHQGPELGELLFGAALGGLLALVVVLGLDVAGP